MKKLIITASIVGVMFSCSQPVDYKAERDEVMKTHDLVMADHGIVVKNQMAIDSLLQNLGALKQRFPTLDIAHEKVLMEEKVARLKAAEELMNDWMHQFEPDIEQKSNEEAAAYFKAEKIKINRIDSLYKAEISASNSYLSAFRE